VAVAAAVWAIAAFCPVPCRGQIQTFETLTLVYDPSTKISVEATGWLGVTRINPAVGNGVVPVTLRVVNGGTRPGVVTVAADDGGWSTGQSVVLPRTEIRVPAGETVAKTLFIDPGMSLESNASSPTQTPIIQFNSRNSGQRVDVRIAFNWAFNALAAGASVGVPAPDGTPPDAPQEQATARRVYTAAANAALRPEGAAWPPATGPAEAIIDLAAAPDDWRGYTALREIVITDDDWTTIPAGTRRALEAWVGLGGLLLVVTDQGDAERLERLGLPRASGDGRRRVGAGEVMVVPPDEATWNALHGRGGPVADARPPAIRPGVWWSPSSFGSRAGLAPRTIPFIPILVFLGAFALLAGPFNIMVLAGKGRPARIFWTTPVISLGATAALLALMFLRDGVGGDGARQTLALLDPDRNAAYVLQQQVSRTGVLLGNACPIRETSWMHPVANAGDGSTSTLRQGTSRYAEVDDTRRTGAWFQSRSDQTYTLQTVRSSRGRLALAGTPDAPEIVSSIDTPLSRVVLLDAAGKAWRCESLGTGERKALSPATPLDLDAVRRELSTDASPDMSVAVDRLFGVPGVAWAEAAAPAEVAIATLDAIRWKHDKAWFVAPLDAEAAP